ncbi:hypothetical protein GQ54DRAFT_141890 [Martensiomyces pterosporus]|nr:hypothetical protein GQ54DRAFT_141890 [Martensiomyces pterosporus]
MRFLSSAYLFEPTVQARCRKKHAVGGGQRERAGHVTGRRFISRPSRVPHTSKWPPRRPSLLAPRFSLTPGLLTHIGMHLHLHRPQTQTRRQARPTCLSPEIT